MLAADRASEWPEYLDRVVIARMYQDGIWTIPAADKYRKDQPMSVRERRVAYVCEALLYLKPSYVSGLVRLSWKDAAPQKDTSRATLDEQAKVFDGVRNCVHRVDKHVRFDVALNALHYTDPSPDPDKSQPNLPVQNAEAGTERMLQRLRSAQAALHPDGWFFDFYASPYDDDTGADRFHRPLEAGIDWIRDTKEHKPRQFVGGTIWGRHTALPPNSDFFAVTDRGGPNYTERLVKDLKAEHKPILMHIDNSPKDPDSKSSQFYNGSEQYRNKVIQQHFNDQQVGYRYMFPVFFPTKPGAVEEFDMRQHPDLFKTMCGYVRDHCGPPPTAPAHTTSAPAPDRPATPTTTPTATPATTPLQGVHRGYHPGSHQYLYSISPQEISHAPGVRLDAANAFYVNPAAGPGLSPLHRCYLGNGWHLLTTHPSCEGAKGAIHEGPLGYIATTQITGTVPLYRLFRPTKPDHFYTTSTAERNRAVTHGYTFEHVAGYVWTTPTK